jgi:hypothetical protein
MDGEGMLKKEKKNARRMATRRNVRRTAPPIVRREAPERADESEAEIGI